MKKSKKILVFLMFTFIICLTGCNTNKGNGSADVKSNNTKENNKLKVAVSIVPQETFVKVVGGEKVDIVTLVPPGKSPGNFGPTPEIMEKLSDASMYFSIGVPTEKANILPKIKDFNKDIKIIDLAEKVSKVYEDRKFESGDRDPHIWLSPKRVKVMVEEISKELSEKDSANKSFYEANAKDYINKLDKLDKDIKDSLSTLKKKAFICYHPAFGYFAEDYGLNMVALEKEGKEATTEDFQKTIDFAKTEGIKAIFYQAEIDSKQSKTFADEIGGKAEKIEPLSPDYINNLEKMSKTFKEVMDVKK